MSDQEPLEAKIARGRRIKEMMQNAAGWKDIEQIVLEMRDEAFNDWSNLPLDASPQKTMEVRAVDIVLKRLLERVRAAVVEGAEAEQLKTQANEEEARTSAFLAEQSTDREISLLGRTQDYITRFFRPTTPSGPAGETVEARASGEPKQ